MLTKTSIELFHSQYKFKQVGLVHVLSDAKAVYVVCFEGELETVLKKIRKTFLVSLVNKENVLNKKAKIQLAEYFAGNRKKFDLSFKLVGTDFQKSVWNVLMKIPYGKTITYKDIGQQLKLTKGFQAIGQANKSNPVCVMIPCHRVISSTGQISGYIGGTGLKSYLLSLEKG